jgi:hypothetical protein
MRGASHDDNALGTESHEIRELIREVANEEGFPSFNLTFEEDSTAMPAVYISFFVHSADAPTAMELQAVRRLRQRVESALFEHGIGRIPYIRFREAPDRAG